MNFLNKSDLPDEWDNLLPECDFFRYKHNYSPVFCLYRGLHFEDCFILVARDEYCMICRGESNDFIGERVARRAICDMFYCLVFNGEKLEKVDYESLDGVIIEDFKGVNIDKNPDNAEDEKRIVDLIFSHYMEGKRVDVRNIHLP